MKTPSARQHKKTIATTAKRHHWVMLLMALGLMALLMRMVYLHLMHNDFLQSQGNARLLRTVPIPAHRGIFVDRQGDVLALSTPVDSVWVNPSKLLANAAQWQTLSQNLDMDVDDLQQKVKTYQQQQFVYLKRHVSPTVAAALKQANISGLHFQREYRRYYPAGAATAHVVGFTNIDDVGQEGLELKLNAELRGISGKKQVIQDRQGRVMADVADIRPPKHGQDIQLTIDKRLSYLLHQHLASALAQYQAKTAMAVLIDTRNGDILAMANQPAYNPNNRNERISAIYRNRVVTDVFEPGSTMKPFAIAAGLESGLYTPESEIDTESGVFLVNNYTIRDSRAYGIIDVATVLKKSSNVGASKIALSLERKQYWRVLAGMGFGQITASGFVGEVTGDLANYRQWHPVKQASLAFGYGISVTLLQLAQAYTVIANDGVLKPLRLLRQQPLAASTRVIQAHTAQQVRQMLAGVTEAGGTATQAQIPRYTVAGKTGTVHKAISGGYAAHRYNALFVGIVPADAPRLVLAVLFDEPKTGNHYGGEVAAPVFSQIMVDVLRILDVPPSF